MDRHYAANVKATPPTAPAVANLGYPTDGDPLVPTPATEPGDWWYYMITESLRRVITDAGGVPSYTNLGLLSASIRALAASGVIGQSRNAKINVAAASANATFTADEIILETGLGGSIYRLAGFNKSVNLATTGAGGMDTGAPPAAGFVAIYAIYNPTTSTSALLAVNATAAVAPEIYGGANMPAGYTASALVAIWRTSGSQFIMGSMLGRSVFFGATQVFNTNLTSGSSSSFVASVALPLNAKSCSGSVTCNQPDVGAALLDFYLASSGSGTGFIGGRHVATGYASNVFAVGGSFSDVPVLTPQTLWYSVTQSSGSFSAYQFYISGYTF